MTARSIQFLTRLSAAVTDAQAAMVAATALDEGVPSREVADGLIAWDELRQSETQVIER